MKFEKYLKKPIKQSKKHKPKPRENTGRWMPGMNPGYSALILPEQQLNERTFNINANVDYIYKKAFKKFIDKFQKTGEIDSKVDIAVWSDRQLILYEMSSEELKGKDAQAAHALNPITIYCGISPTGGSYYLIGGKLIWISLQKDVISMVKRGQRPPPGLLKSWKAELTEGRMKATIYHELSHWLNDTLHNYNITNIVKLAMELGTPTMNLLGKKSVDMTHFEIDAQVHGIKQIKRTYKDEWDTYTFDDILDLYPALRAVADVLRSYGRDVVSIWTRSILKRMAREKLLGKNMRGKGTSVRFE